MGTRDKTQLVRVKAPHFVAGFVITSDIVTLTAPILTRALHGKSRDQARAIIAHNGWSAAIIRASS